MGLQGKMEVEVDIKSCGDVFHELWSTKPHHVSNIVPDKIHGCDVHEGDYGHVGSIILWTYTHDGRKCTAKEEIEAIDEENKLIRLKIIEGEILEEFKNFTCTIHVIDKGEICGVKWIFEFEKIHDHGPYPTDLMDFAIGITRDIESHHLQA
ncbi:MLP-like protein 43 [Amaranthus tricolor]|uniref:MLP-like protein 43 n=1 Tax=Amaranthus tricolor TaxID=29722 RepID=UPI002587356C|nr:MLP-like protein 43 [Amaranthus tricolor]